MNDPLFIRMSGPLFDLVAGIIATLMGFRLQRKLLKWGGPLLIVFSFYQFTVAFTSSTSGGGTESNQKKVQAIQENVSSAGKLAEYDQTFEAPEGFKVMIPKGYTYSKPNGTPFGLVALNDAKGAKTPAFSVAVTKLNSELDHVIENVKAGLIAKNQTTKFTETQVVEMGSYKLYRTSMDSQRETGLVKGGMLFFEKGNKVFMLSYGTLDTLFESNKPVFEKIILSFAPSGTVAPSVQSKELLNNEGARKRETSTLPPTSTHNSESNVTIPITPPPVLMSQGSVSQAPRHSKINRDLRYCLELKTNAEIIACADKSR